MFRAHTNMSSYCVGIIAVTLLVTIMGISVVSVEDGNETFLSNRSMRNLVANVRFDNGSDAEFPHYSNVVIGPRRYASIENNVEKGKVLVDLWVQGSSEHKHFELTIGTERSLVALDNEDHWGVDIFHTVQICQLSQRKSTCHHLSLIADLSSMPNALDLNFLHSWLFSFSGHDCRNIESL